MYFYIIATKQKQKKDMKNLIAKYEALETKQENGTITMDEDATRVKTYDLIQKFLFK